MTYLLTATVSESKKISEFPAILAGAREINLYAGEKLGCGIFLLTVTGDKALYGVRLIAVGFGEEALRRLDYGMEQAEILAGPNAKWPEEHSPSCTTGGIISGIFSIMAKHAQRHFMTVIDGTSHVPITTVAYVRTRDSIAAFTEAVRQYDHSRN